MSREQIAERVDVIIAAYNCAGTLERAVRSALAQPECRTVYVVDDASTDDTVPVAQSIATEGSRVVVIRQPVNRGPSAARNRALEMSDAPWFAILDSDDYLLPGRLRALLDQSSAADFIADNPLRVAEHAIGTEPPVPMLSPDPFPPRHLDLVSFALGNLSRAAQARQELGFLKPLVRRSFIEERRLRYDEAVRLGEDYLLYARSLAAGARFRIISAAGYVAVMRRDSLSGRHSLADLEALRDRSRAILREFPRLTPAEDRAIIAAYQSVDARAQWLRVIEAVKARKLWAFTRPFLRSPRVTRFLVARLAEQVAARGRARLAAAQAGQRSYSR